MTEKRFFIHRDIVSDTDMKIPITLWSDKKQQKKFCDELNALHEENKALKKEIHLMHMRAMFSTVKSFKGDISTRYKYDEKMDTIYDTANNYGQYDKILDKKEIVMLLNEYNTLLGDKE